MNKLTHNSFEASSIMLGVLLNLTLISGYVLVSTTVSADDTSVDNISIIVPTACSVTPTIDSPHTATINPGTYTADIGTTTLKAYCNNTEGFAIYAIGYTGEQYTGENHTKLVGTTNSSNTISTGTATSGNTSNWAMKLSTPSSPTPAYPITIDNSFSSYHVIPDTYTKVAHRDSGTDVGSNAEGSTLTTTYAALISSTQPADTYAGKVKYTLVHPSSETPLQPKTTEAGCIRYYPNGSGVVGTMGCQSVSTSATSATLLASNFSRAGYGFAGWSDAFDYATNPNANFYGPQEYITFTAGQYTGSNPGLSLYAIWVKSEGSLQDSSKVSSVCSNLTTAPTDGTANLRSVSALTDQRDNETYAIAKLADGNCWMIENLRLESTNSDNATGALAQGYGTSTTYGNFSGLASAENANFTASASSATEPTAENSLYYAGTKTGDATIDISQTNFAGFRMPRYNSDNHQTTSEGRPQNPTSNSANNSTTSAGMYSYGNYYTWAAAIADTTYYNTRNQSVTNTSLCPKGWHLPQGGNKTRIVSDDDNDFWNLTVDYLNGGTLPANYESSTYPYYTGTTEGTPVSNKLRSFPNNFLYSGYFNGSSATSRGSSGYYWSSTADYNDNSYLLNLSSSSVLPGTTNYNKYSGRSIRCVTGS